MPHNWSQLGIGQDFFFSLSIHTWIIKILKYFFFPSQHKQQQQLQCAQLHSVELTIAKIFFSLSIHMQHMSPSTFLSLFSSLSSLFSHLSVVTEPLLWLSLSTTLRITLADSLSTYCSLWLYLYVFFSLFLSSYAHLSLFLSKNISFSHYKSTIINKYYIFFYFFLASDLRIWVLKSSIKFGFNT